MRYFKALHHEFKYQGSINIQHDILPGHLRFMAKTSEGKVYRHEETSGPAGRPGIHRSYIGCRVRLRLSGEGIQGHLYRHRQGYVDAKKLCGDISESPWHSRGLAVQRRGILQRSFGGYNAFRRRQRLPAYSKGRRLRLAVNILQRPELFRKKRASKVESRRHGIAAGV